MTLLAESSAETARYRVYGARQLGDIANRYSMPADLLETIRLTAEVLPFRVNEYVLSELVDWCRVPEDPIFQLLFPQVGMLDAADIARLRELDRQGVQGRCRQDVINDIRAGLNPHPSGQKELNVPTLDGEAVPGMQHKYKETVLYFPSQGQSCHAFCTYCFRWAQFVGNADLRFAATGPEQLVKYLSRHPLVSDVLVTGGDPMVMSAERLRSHLEPVLEVETVRTVRIGTKSVAYWPNRFLTDRDADETLRFFERIVASGRQLAVMAHYSHPRELETDVARQAIARIRATGAVVYCQAPLIAHVNDSADVWDDMWRAELAAGAVPYYMFVERDTGPHDYFKVPLARAVEIFHAAYRRLPGLARTVRGPVMSATPGKVAIDGVSRTSTGRYFNLRMLQARNPALVGRPFRARFDTAAAWLDDLELEADTPADIAAAVSTKG